LKILVTGSTGFVGRWLVRDLQGSGHEAVESPASAELDLTNRDAVAGLLDRVRPDAVAHLAGVSYGPDARRDPDLAFAVNVGGTETLIAAIAAASPGAALLVAGSSEVYGRPRPEDLPLTEDAPTEPTQPYGLSKLAQERAALAAAERYALPVVVARSFNHTGPGQRPEFVAPALARRVLAARAAGDREIPVGNVDVKRDLGDVRDVVRAYRLLLEGLAAGAIGSGSVANVATGRAVAIREVLAILSRLAGVDAEPRVNAALVRADDPPEIVGDASRLRASTGWVPRLSLDQTLGDLLRSIESTAPPPA
jgi:GDP-4-dehydro-6-deoxy-D-mannose reductase